MLSRHRMIWLLPHPLAPLPSANCTVSLTQSSCVSPVELTDGDGRGRAGQGGHEAKSYDIEKAWSSINHSILSGLETSLYFVSCSLTSLCDPLPQTINERFRI
jgi:hypothetical protein